MKESKLTKYTLVAMALLLIAYFSTDARASETEDNVGTIAAICSASYALITVYHEKTPMPGGSDVVARVYYEQGRWWTNFLAAWLDSDEAAAAAITIMIKNIAKDMNAGNLTYSDLIDTVKACSPIKQELLELGSEEETGT